MTTNTADSSTDVKEWRRLQAWVFHLAVRRLHRKPKIIRACFRQCGLVGELVTLRPGLGSSRSH